MRQYSYMGIGKFIFEADDSEPVLLMIGEACDKEPTDGRKGDP